MNTRRPSHSDTPRASAIDRAAAQRMRRAESLIRWGLGSVIAAGFIGLLAAICFAA